MSRKAKRFFRKFGKGFVKVAGVVGSTTVAGPLAGLNPILNTIGEVSSKLEGFGSMYESKDEGPIVFKLRDGRFIDTRGNSYSVEEIAANLV